jgi:hypothetical protein
MTSTNKATKKPWQEASELVEAGKAKFISRTEFRAHTLGVKVPADIKKQGDRAIKDYIQSKAAPTGRKARKSKDADDAAETESPSDEG